MCEYRAVHNPPTSLSVERVRFTVPVFPLASQTASQQASKPASQQASKPASQQASKPASQQASKPASQASMPQAACQDVKMLN